MGHGAALIDRGYVLESCARLWIRHVVQERYGAGEFDLGFG
jgi:hypothetical protein